MMISNNETINLINQLNKDPMFSYKITRTNDEYELIIYWFEEGYGEYERILKSTKDLSELNGLLSRLLDRLHKAM